MHRLQPLAEQAGNAVRINQRRRGSGRNAKDPAIDAKEQELEQPPAFTALFQLRFQPCRQFLRQGENIVLALDRL
ncbi:hypothetical protein D3C71_2184870 [compost metagenome]